MEIINTITYLAFRHRGMAIGLNSDQRYELKHARNELKHALTHIGGAELADPAPAVPSKHTGPIVLLDGSTIEVTDAEVLGIFGGTTIVAVGMTRRTMSVEKLMTIDDVAGVLGTSAKQVRNMRTRGQLLPPLDLPGVQLRWRRVDVENWLAGRVPIQGGAHG